MGKHLQRNLILGAVLVAALVGFGSWFFGTYGAALLHPAGTIGRQERNLIVFTLLLSLVVVVPTFFMLFYFAWKYRDTNPRKDKVNYQPEWDHSKLFESIWWLIPGALIALLSVITWTSSHHLDPYKPIASAQKPLKVQVVAMNWKWLFIYPKQHVATVNYLEIPAKRPVHFYLTGDAPMNMFWVPRLGSQIMVMAGMRTQLHLEADHPGSFDGWSSNISGHGFAGMHFTAHAASPDDFRAWVASAQSSSKALTMKSYEQLARPSTYNPKTVYADVQPELFHHVIMSYMQPGTQLAQKRAQLNVGPPKDHFSSGMFKL
jgi:cytochrome o ubiquinol oxidase subunit 2